jgi:hypothetical protein
MSEYVVLDAAGRFLGPGRRWFAEYPEAMVWDNASTARKAAHGVKVLCEVVEDYGLSTQRTIDTVQGK